MRRKLKIGLGVTLSIIIILFIAFSIFIGKATFDGMTENVSREETNKNLASYKGIYDKFAEGKDIKDIKKNQAKTDMKFLRFLSKIQKLLAFASWFTVWEGLSILFQPRVIFSMI